jgi:CO/xanthine dehydrogenase FAD-binding subunit
MKTSQAPVHRATSLPEALAFRAAHPDATVLAGGTDLMVFLEADQIDPVEVIDIWACHELRGLSSVKSGATGAAGLRFGALTTFADLRDDLRVPAVLRECARTVGAMQIQNRATLGGNIVNGSPAGDSLPLWLALDARFVVASTTGQRTIPVTEFWTGYRSNSLAPDELLIAIEVDDPCDDALVYRKVGTRLAQAISKVVLGGRIRQEGGVVREARIALGSVAATPVRCPAAEAALVGNFLSEGSISACVDALGTDIQPIDDVRSTASYRLTVARNVTKTWLHTV